MPGRSRSTVMSHTTPPFEPDESVTLRDHSGATSLCPSGRGVYAGAYLTAATNGPALCGAPYTCTRSVAVSFITACGAVATTVSIVTFCPRAEVPTSELSTELSTRCGELLLFADAEARRSGLGGAGRRRGADRRRRAAPR